MTIHAQLMTRPGCPLCDEMKRELERAAAGLDLLLVEVDVSESSELERMYGNDVPVLFLDGQRAFQHRATERELRRRLRALGS